MKLYRVTYLVREGSRASCLVRAKDHHEAAKLARREHDDIIGVRRVDEAEVRRKKGPGLGTVVGIVLFMAAVAGVAVLVYLTRAGR